MHIRGGHIMDHLNHLEAQSIFILREAYKVWQTRYALVYWKRFYCNVLAGKKAFFGHCPFPFIHVDTSYKIPEMIEYRDKIAREYNIDLIVHQNKKALSEEWDLIKETCLL